MSIGRVVRAGASGSVSADPRDALPQLARLLELLRPPPCCPRPLSKSSVRSGLCPQRAFLSASALNQARDNPCALLNLRRGRPPSSAGGFPEPPPACGCGGWRTNLRRLFNTNVVRITCALDRRAPSVGGIQAGWGAPPSVARGSPPPLLAPPRSLWSRPRRVAGASGDRLSGFALPFFVGWRHRGCAWRLVARLPRPRGVVCPYSRVLWDCSPFGSQSQRTRPWRAHSPLASVACSLLSHAPPFSPPMALAFISDNSISRDKIYHPILYRMIDDFVFEIKLPTARTQKEIVRGLRPHSPDPIGALRAPSWVDLMFMGSGAGAPLHLQAANFRGVCA